MSSSSDDNKPKWKISPGGILVIAGIATFLPIFPAAYYIKDAILSGVCVWLVVFGIITGVYICINKKHHE